MPQVPREEGFEEVTTDTNFFATHWFGCWRDPGHHDCAVALLKHAVYDFRYIASAKDCNICRSNPKLCSAHNPILIAEHFVATATGSVVASGNRHEATGGDE